MKLGLNTGYWGVGTAGGHRRVDRGGGAARVRLGLDRRGLRVGPPDPAGVVGRRDHDHAAGTAIVQMSARTPAATAMAAISLDHLSGGRFILGLGASGPQVVEGWYGMPYPKPLARTREYVAIVRQILAREKPVEFAGEHYRLPYPGGTGPRQGPQVDRAPAAGRPAHLAGGRGAEERRPGRRDRRRLAADVLRPEGGRPVPGLPRRGLRPARRPRSADDFEVADHGPGRDPATTSRRPPTGSGPCVALYIGGMGAKGANFHFDVFARMGYEDEATEDPGAVPRRRQGRSHRRRARPRWSRRWPSWARWRSCGTTSKPGASPA